MLGQVILKPDPGRPQELYLGSLEALGIDTRAHDLRFVEDNWENPTLGAWGLGWEVWMDGEQPRRQQSCVAQGPSQASPGRHILESWDTQRGCHPHLISHSGRLRLQLHGASVLRRHSSMIHIELCLAGTMSLGGCPGSS